MVRLLRVVLDTNVLISALIFGGVPAQVFDLAIQRDIQLYLSLHILSEVERVLDSKIGADEVRRSKAQALLRRHAKLSQSDSFQVSAVTRTMIMCLRVQ